MKRISLIWAVLLVPMAAVADERYCQQQTDHLLERVDRHMQPPLSSVQRGVLARLSHDACMQQSPLTQAAPPKGYKDWWTYFLLNNYADKAGNKRLKRLK